jgi:hypothetical protein
MSKRVFQPAITLFLAVIMTTSLLVGCTATTAVTPTAALPTSTARPTGTPPPIVTPAAALPTSTARPMGTPPPTITATARLPTNTITPTGAAPTARPAGQPGVVVFVQDGDIQVWDEATGQTETIFSSGDVIAVTMSDDGQVVAFLRRSPVKRSELDWYEQSALWAVERDGGNPRELVGRTLSRLRASRMPFPEGSTWLTRIHSRTRCCFLQITAFALCYPPTAGRSRYYPPRHLV